MHGATGQGSVDLSSGESQCEGAGVALGVRANWGSLPLLFLPNACHLRCSDLPLNYPNRKGLNALFFPALPARYRAIIGVVGHSRRLRQRERERDRVKEGHGTDVLLVMRHVIFSGALSREKRPRLCPYVEKSFRPDDILINYADASIYPIRYWPGVRRTRTMVPRLRATCKT